MQQTVREVIGLSVAVILGFNIGDGNLRDRLQGGQTVLRVVLGVFIVRLRIHLILVQASDTDHCNH